MAPALQADIIASIAIQQSGSSVSIANGAYSNQDVARNLANEQYLVVANSVSNQALSLGGITTVLDLLIISDHTISIKVNSSATAIPGKVFLFSEAAITSVTISNASGAAAGVQVAMSGS